MSGTRGQSSREAQVQRRTRRKGTNKTQTSGSQNAFVSTGKGEEEDVKLKVAEVLIFSLGAGAVHCTHQMCSSSWCWESPKCESTGRPHGHGRTGPDRIWPGIRSWCNEVGQLFGFRSGNCSCFLEQVLIQKICFEGASAGNPECLDLRVVRVSKFW